MSSLSDFENLNYQPILVNLTVFTCSSFLAHRFLSRYLFSEQDLSKARLNKGIFCTTFALCMVMLTCFLQQVQNTFDMATANQIWKILFLLMDINLLLVIPLALLKDLCCQKDQKKKKRVKSKVLSVCACSCFTMIFLVDALIFNTYLGAADSAQNPQHDNSQQDSASRQ